MTSDSQALNDGWSAPGDAEDAVATPGQPAGTTIQIERFADGISITVPPAGLWGNGLFVFGLVWTVVVAVLTVMFVTIAHAAKPGEGVWIAYLVMSIFWLAGIALLVGGINMGRRQAGLAVAGGTLMVLQTGLFGKKHREWPLAEIAAISLGPTGLEVNDVPVLELQIHDTDGRKVGLLGGRTNDELAWLAYELRQAAKLPESK
ncbi:MAG: hypothetical protein L0211_25690 [Planctomycetaceae bacterium]|nr:hypothetical protein [Planctomycetaceae bacterium]